MSYVTFEKVTMGWNAENVKPFSFDNTMKVTKEEPLEHLMAWTAVVARGAEGGKLKALVINCHGYYGFDYAGTLGSAGGSPSINGGFGLDIGDGGIGGKNAGHLFQTLANLVLEIHIYGCGAAVSPTPLEVGTPVSFCQTIADASRAIVVAADYIQPDVEGPGLNLAPPMVGKVTRFTPSKNP